MIVLVLALAVLSVFSGCAEQSPYVKQARQYAQANNWDESVRMYQRALEEDPDNPDIKLMLSRAKEQAAIAHMIRGEALLKERLFNEAIGELQISYAFNPTNANTAKLIQIATNKKEADHLFKRAQNLLKGKKYDEARKLLLKAQELDPQNEDIQATIDRFKKRKDPQKRFPTDFQTTAPVSFKFKKTPIINIFEVLSKLTGMNFIFDKEMRDNKVTLFMTDVSFDQFLDVLLQTNNLAAKVVSEKTMIIYPDTPAKRNEYEELQIRTFYLTNLEAKKAVGLLSKILKSKNIIANENLNAIVIRGSKDEVAIASRLIAANDGPPAEVLLNVELLQVSRTKERQLGLEISDAVTLGIGESAPEISNDSGLASFGSLYALGNLSSKELLLSLPTATLNLLKQDADTRILAKPQIRVKNGKKSSFLIGERVPIRVNRRVDSGTGDVTSDFQYQDVGIKVEAQPNINVNDEINIQLYLEISALGPNLGTADDPQFSILTRTARSELTVRDGETVIIGGLISDEERQTIRKVPALGDIPAVGTMFSSVDIEDNNTDILMVINPIITRRQEIPDTEITQIWSGQDTTFSQREPFESTAGKRNTYFLIPRSEAAPELSQTPQTPPEETAGLPDLAAGPSTEPGSRAPAEPPPSLQPSPASAPPSTTARSATAETPSETAALWPSGAAFSIHVNSYLKKTEAEARLKELGRLNYKPFVIPASVSGMGYFYRVFVGTYLNFSAANSAKELYKTRSEFAPDIHVVDRKWALGQ